MTRRFHRHRLVRKFLAADGAVNHFVILSVCRAGCRDFVFANRLAFCMTCRGNLFIRCIIASRACVIRFPADFRTRRCFRFVMHQIMTERRNLSRFHMQRIVCTNTLFFTRFRTGRGFGLFPFAPCMARNYYRRRHIFNCNGIKFRIDKIIAGNI